MASDTSHVIVSAHIPYDRWLACNFFSVCVDAWRGLNGIHSQSSKQRPTKLRVDSNRQPRYNGNKREEVSPPKKPTSAMLVGFLYDDEGKSISEDFHKKYRTSRNR